MIARTSTRRGGALVALLLLAVVVAGCGASDPVASSSPSKSPVVDTRPRPDVRAEAPDLEVRLDLRRKRACNKIGEKASRPAADLARLYFAVGVHYGGTQRLMPTCPQLMRRLARAAEVDLAADDEASTSVTAPLEQPAPEAELEGDETFDADDAVSECDALIEFFNEELSAGNITESEWDELTDEALRVSC